MQGFYFMSTIYCNIHDCGLTVYHYTLKNTTIKNNYIPIFVINLPYSSSQLASNNIFFTNTSAPSGSFFGIQLKDLNYKGVQLPFWDYSLSGKQHIACLEIYQDDLFTISTTTFTNQTGYTNTYSISIKSHNTTLTIKNINTSVYQVHCGIIFQFCFYKTTDNRYISYNQNAITTQRMTFSGKTGDSVNVISSPVSSSSKGLLESDNDIIAYTSDFNTSIVNLYENIILDIIGKSKIYDDKDPNNGSGDSSGGGGGGSSDIGGDEHQGGTTPTISALDSGLITLYNPTVSELQNLGQFLWSDSFDVNTFKKLFNDPFDTLLGLSVIPIKPNISGTHNIIFGNLDSGVSSSIVSNQWVPIDCGTLDLGEVWNGALDYSPYTQVSIYLPFIGVKQLNVNDVMGSTLSLKYMFDVLSGGCIAEISINHSSQGNKENGFSYGSNMGTVYTFEGQCATNIPLSSMDFTNTIRAAISSVAIGAGALATTAAGHPALGLATIAVGMANTGIQSNTPTVERSGQLSGSNSIMASLQPCLFVSRPHICKPEKYYALRGVPSQVYVDDINKCTGFFQLSDIQNIHVSGATDSELDQVKALLTQGVFVSKWPTKSVTKESSVKLTLYNNKSSKNTIDKNISAVRDDNILDGTFRDSCDIENPVIRIKLNDVSSINNLNYMYIGIFQRYYYITKITSMRNHIVEITGHVDVLMTYGYEIGLNTGIIARSSQVPAYGNTYLDDNLLATYQDTYNVSYNWGYSFSHDNDNLILAVAGALQS